MIVTDPSSFRFSVTGNVLDIPKPKADWEIFRRRSASGRTPVCPYFLPALAYTKGPNQPVEPAPIRLAEETLSELGKKPSKKVCQFRYVGKRSATDGSAPEGGRTVASNDRE